jgi:hypothetical protein
MVTDEIEAFRIACISARDRGWPWQPPYWLELNNGEWQIQAECERIIRVSQTNGNVIPEVASLDPIAAMSVARTYALENSLPWRPGFSLTLSPEHWVIGACQSQFGGQTSIYVNHRGEAVRHWVNPK